MFETWTVSTWAILVIDIVAVVIVAVFLKRKIQHKPREVEARQAHERLMRKQTAKAEENDTPPS